MNDYILMADYHCFWKPVDKTGNWHESIDRKAWQTSVSSIQFRIKDQNVPLLEISNDRFRSRCEIGELMSVFFKGGWILLYHSKASQINNSVVLNPWCFFMVVEEW